jgi:uncharacterized protein YjbI with pentapeptide repeats
MHTIIKIAVVSVLSLFAIVGLVSISKAEDIDNEREIQKFISLNSCNRCIIKSADFNGINLDEVEISDGVFIESNFQNQDLSNAQNLEASFISSDFRNTKINGGVLEFLSGNNLQNATITNSNIDFNLPFGGVIGKPISTENIITRASVDNAHIKTNLEGANFSGSEIHGFLTNLDFSKTNLKNTKIYGFYCNTMMPWGLEEGYCKDKIELCSINNPEFVPALLSEHGFFESNFNNLSKATLNSPYPGKKEKPIATGSSLLLNLSSPHSEKKEKQNSGISSVLNSMNLSSLISKTKAIQKFSDEPYSDYFQKTLEEAEYFVTLFKNLENEISDNLFKIKTIQTIIEFRERTEYLKKLNATEIAPSIFYVNEKCEKAAIASINNAISNRVDEIVTKTKKDKPTKELINQKNNLEQHLNLLFDEQIKLQESIIDKERILQENLTRLEISRAEKNLKSKINEHISYCWNPPPFYAGAPLEIGVNVIFDKFGNLESLKFLNMDKYETNNMFRTAVRSIERAMMKCNFHFLQENEYNELSKEFEINFKIDNQAGKGIN